MFSLLNAKIDQGIECIVNQILAINKNKCHKLLKQQQP